MAVFFAFQLDCQTSKRIDSLKTCLAKKSADSTKVREFLYLINELTDISEYDSVSKYSTFGLKLSLQLMDSFYTQKFYSRLGVCAWNLSNYSKALDYYNKGIKFCRFDKEYGGYYNNMGLVYWDQGDLPKALKFFLKSNDIDKKNGDIEGMATSLLNIGLIYDDLKDVKNALKYYYESLQFARQINSQQTIGICYNNIGKLYSDLKQEQKALDFYSKAFQTSSKAGDKKNAAMAANNIGAIFLDKRKMDSAMKYLNWANEAFKKIGDVAGASLVVNNLGHLYYTLKNYDLATKMYKEAIKVNTMANNLEELSISYRGLSLVLNATGNYKESYTNFMVYDQLKDTIVKNQNALLLSDIRKEYDIKEKEKEINLKRTADKKLSDAEKKKQTYIIISVILILGLVIVFSFFLYKRFKLSQKQNRIIQTQKHIVEEKQKEILDSIHYAKRIQTTIIANQNFINENIPNNFVYFNPKDIVSGDFYWATKRDHLFYLAICDSTGHGVPGAFMSLLNIGFLSEAINEKDITEPNLIFDYVRDRLVNSISKEGQKDGFDGILVCFNTQNNKISYAAANNEPILIRNNDIIELTKDKMPVGIGERTEKFKLFSYDPQKGDVIYFYTDGYADQFGGPKGKKFKYKQLNELLKLIHLSPLEEQRNILQNKFNEWRGDLEQVDDICIIAVKI